MQLTNDLPLLSLQNISPLITFINNTVIFFYYQSNLTILLNHFL